MSLSPHAHSRWELLAWHDQGMCVDHGARLPALPAGTHHVTSERLVLEASDGTRFNALAASPDAATGPAMLVLPDVRGLFGFYQDLACQFAAHGHPAIAIDYFGRTAGIDDRDAEFPFMEHIPQTTSAGLNADIAAAVSWLRSSKPGRKVFAVGFCFGGNIAWGAATHGHGLAGVVGFYGKPEADRPAGDGPIWDRCDLIEGGVLALFGGDDPGIPAENIERLERALAEAGVDHEVVTYPGAPHSFFGRSQASFTTESLDAWNRITRFLNAF
jgi:carboxymethylenebutenolidase